MEVATVLEWPRESPVEVIDMGREFGDLSGQGPYLETPCFMSDV